MELWIELGKIYIYYMRIIYESTLYRQKSDRKKSMRIIWPRIIPFRPRRFVYPCVWRQRLEDGEDSRGTSLAPLFKLKVKHRRGRITTLRYPVPEKDPVSSTNNVERSTCARGHEKTDRLSRSASRAALPSTNDRQPDGRQNGFANNGSARVGTRYRPKLDTVCAYSS